MTIVKALAACEDELHEIAMQRAGLSDFGDSSYRAGLQALLEAYDTDFRLTEQGWQVGYNNALRALIARLYAQRGWSDRPEALHIAMERPLIIIGLPRTGSTALHWLLSTESRLQGLEAWLSVAPMPRPARESWPASPAYQAYVNGFQASYAHLMELFARRLPESHTTGETYAEKLVECTAVVMQGFICEAWSAVGLPTYSRWLRTQTIYQSYRYLANVLRLIGVDEPDKRWLLKGPHLMSEIEALLEVLPDACVVQTHRDPLKSIPSFCAMLQVGRRGFEGETARPEVLGQQECTRWRMALDRMQAARRDRPGQFYDVDHRQFIADPLGTVRALYEQLGLRISEAAERRMNEWAVANRAEQRGEFKTTAEAWGITSDEICTRFADYRAERGFA